MPCVGGHYFKALKFMTKRLEDKTIQSALEGQLVAALRSAAACCAAASRAWHMDMHVTWQSVDFLYLGLGGTACSDVVGRTHRHLLFLRGLCVARATSCFAFQYHSHHSASATAASLSAASACRA